MTPNILLVAGLPGSGKTTYLCELEGRGWLCFDDFKNAAINNSRQFRQSPHCATLLTRLREGVRCVVTDIDFCHTESRREATDVLRAEVSSVDIRWLYFSHNVEDCAANIIRQGPAFAAGGLKRTVPVFRLLPNSVRRTRAPLLS